MQFDPCGVATPFWMVEAPRLRRRHFLATRPSHSSRTLSSKGVLASQNDRSQAGQVLVGKSAHHSFYGAFDIERRLVILILFVDGDIGSFGHGRQRLYLSELATGSSLFAWQESPLHK